MEKLEISYLAKYPEHIQTCACWVYGLWGSQSGGSFEMAVERFVKGANTGALPVTFIALCDGKPAGMASLWESDAGRPELTPWLAALYVHPFHRKKHIAINLIERSVAEAKNLGYKEIYLVTEEARGLYERFGWTEVTKTKTPYGKASLMVKRL